MKTINNCILISDEDFDKVSAFNWRIKVERCGNQYAETWIKSDTGKHKRLFMHHLILGRKDGFVTDHKDGNGLNNQRSNLRFATPQQNVFNRRTFSNTGLKGITRLKSGRFRAQICVNGKRIHLGYFGSLTKASEFYNTKAKEYHGKFAYLNEL